MVERPVRLTATRSQMDVVSIGTTDSASPKHAREAYAEQMRKQLDEALKKLRKHDVRRGCVLIVTDHTNAPDEAGSAFTDVEPSHYDDCAGVFWFNPSKRPFGLKALYAGRSLFADSDR